MMSSMQTNSGVQPEDVDIHWDVLDVSKLSSALLEALAERQSSGRDWAHASHDPVKKILKKELLELQLSKCAYCRRDIKDELGHVEIEHVLPKNSFGNPPRWTSNLVQDRKCTEGYAAFRFGHLNLVLVCKRCNNKKGSYDCRIDRSVPAFTLYPLTSGSLCWVHPYHDPYSLHIRLRRGFIYQVANNSASGRAVIDTCDLADIRAVEMRSAERIVKRSRDVNKAMLSLAPNLETWSDDDIVDFLKEQFPQMEEQKVRSSIDAMRKGDVMGMGR